MKCTKNCTPKVEKALSEVEGVKSVIVSLTEKSATVLLSHPVNQDKLIEAVQNVEYSASSRVNNE